MPTERPGKTIATSRNGYSVVLIERIDDDGNVLEVVYSVRDPNGKEVNRRSSEAAAIAIMNAIDPPEPEPEAPSGPGM